MFNPAQYKYASIKQSAFIFMESYKMDKKDPKHILKIKDKIDPNKEKWNPNSSHYKSLKNQYKWCQAHDWNRTHQM